MGLKPSSDSKISLKVLYGGLCRYNGHKRASSSSSFSSHHLLVVNLTFRPPPSAFEVAGESRGALLTGAGSAERRSVCLWGTALARGLIGRPPVHCRLCAHTNSMTTNSNTGPLCPRGAAVTRPARFGGWGAPAAAKTALKSSSKQPGFGDLKKSAWLRFRTTRGHVA